METEELDQSRIDQLLDEEELNEFPLPSKESPGTRVVVVDCVPIIPKAKEARLLGLLKTVAKGGKAGTRKVVDIFMPFSDEGMSYGFFFVEYASVAEASDAIGTLNNFVLDKSHTFKANFYSEVKVSEEYPAEYKTPEGNDTPFENMHDMYNWLLDERGRDQFVCRFGDDAQINWGGIGGSAPTLEYSKKNWTDMSVHWSPRGTYLASLHHLGIMLWGGDQWRKLKRFHHEGVNLIAFSPCERYMITCSEKHFENDNPKDPQGIVVWDVLSARRLRGFVQTERTWPAFQWSPNDDLFSFVHKGLVWVYETPSMKLMGGKPMKLHGPVLEHAWSPTDPYLACFVPEHGQIPARVIIRELPSKKLIGQQAMFNVEGCNLLWQRTGDFLGVKVDRHKKSKKQKFTSFEFFHLREKGIPVVSVNLDECVIQYDFEPTKGGKRFGIIHAVSPTASRTNVTFFSLANGNLKKLCTLENRPANLLVWSPAGRYCVLAGLKNINGVFEFFDVQTQSVLADEKKHYMCTDVAWDPSGRYFTTYVSHWSNKSENGYTIWSWSGKKLYAKRTSLFYQFAWRPRLPSMLEKSDKKKLRNPKHFSQFTDKYRKQDRESVLALFSEAREERRRIRNLYRSRVAALKKAQEEDTQWKVEQGIVTQEEDDYVTVEELISEVVSVKEEVVKDGEE